MRVLFDTILPKQKAKPLKQLQTLFWFATRPRYYPYFLEVLTRKIDGWQRPSDFVQMRQQASAWCAERAISRDDALYQLTGAHPPQSFESRFAGELVAAHTRAEQCPVKMGGPGDIALLYWLAEHVQALRVIETGVAYGWSSLALLLSLQNRPAACLMSTDRPYIKRGNDAYVGCVVPVELREQWQLINNSDRRALPSAIKALAPLDLCHYDSDKSYKGRMWAYPLLWEVMRPGGVFISDDIGDNFAFRDFCDSLQCTPTIIRHQDDYIGLLIK